MKLTAKEAKTLADVLRTMTAANRYFLLRDQMRAAEQVAPLDRRPLGYMVEGAVFDLDTMVRNAEVEE